jgi:hypothetical protein
VGVTYSGSTAKQAEHGGFSHDDTNVMILVSNPKITAKTLTTPVQTAQIAPTILSVLGLNPRSLQAVQIQGTEGLPGVSLGNNLQHDGLNFEWASLKMPVFLCPAPDEYAVRFFRSGGREARTQKARVTDFIIPSSYRSGHSGL